MELLLWKSDISEIKVLSGGTKTVERDPAIAGLAAITVNGRDSMNRAGG